MKRLSSTLLLALAGLLLSLGLVGAIGNPDYVQVNAVFVFRDLLESDDQLYFVRYDVSFATNQTENAEDTWQMALYNEDGSTLVTTRPLNYYQHNIISVYLSASEALTWGAEYVIRIMGMPSVYANLTEDINVDTWVLGSGAYYEGSELGGTMVSQAGILEADWDIVLLTAQNRLNTTGAVFFSEAVPGLGSMVPEIFETASVRESTDTVPWSRNYTESLVARTGGRLSAAMTSLGSAVGLSGNWMSSWMVSVLFLVAAGVVYSSTRNPMWALVVAFPFVVMTAFVGLGGETMLLVVLLIVLALTVLFGLVFILPRFV